MIVVSDTSPLTNLMQIGRVEILEKLFGQVVVPEAVLHELQALEFQRKILENLPWLRAQMPEDEALVQNLSERLDAGEAAAITLAVQLQADLLLMDERRGRRTARQFGIKMTGLLGVLVIAKEHGLISNVAEVVDELVSATSFRASGQLIDATLRLAGER